MSNAREFTHTLVIVWERYPVYLARPFHEYQPECKDVSKGEVLLVSLPVIAKFLALV